MYTVRNKSLQYQRKSTAATDLLHALHLFCDISLQKWLIATHHDQARDITLRVCKQTRTVSASTSLKHETHSVISNTFLRICSQCKLDFKSPSLLMENGGLCIITPCLKCVSNRDAPKISSCMIMVLPLEKTVYFEFYVVTPEQRLITTCYFLSNCRHSVCSFGFVLSVYISHHPLIDDPH